MWKKLGVVVLLVVMLIMIASCNGNKKPTALFSVDVLQGKSPLTVNFNGAISTDEDGEIVAHEWDFDDSETAEGPQVTHTFTSQDDRVFDVRLTVTDDQGGRASTSTNIHVEGSSTSMGDVLFFDDFEDGLDPGWYTSEGWSINGGKLTPVPIHWRYAYILDGTTWTDYAIEVDVEPRSSTTAVILRCSEDLQDYVTMEATTDAVRWRVFKDREEIETSESISPGLFAGVNHVRVEVQGSQYSVYIEDLLRLQYTFSGYSKGMPGLASISGFWNATGSNIDNFRVTELQ